MYTYNDYNDYVKVIFDFMKFDQKYKGYHYLFDVICIRIGQPMYKRKIYTVVYRMIAEKYHVSYGSVERDIRTLIDHAWTKEFSEYQYRFYGRIISSRTQKPSPAKLIEETVQIIYRMRESDCKENKKYIKYIKIR